jgi:hypothetical protein
VRVSHFPLELGFWRERRNGVDDHEVDGTRANEHLGDIERLLSRIGLRDEKLLRFDADSPRVRDVERVLRVDERRDAACLLGLRDRVQRERRLPARLGPVDLDDPAARKAADPRRQVERERSGRDRSDGLGIFVVSEGHDGPLSKLFFDRGHHAFEGTHLVCNLFKHRCSPCRSISRRQGTRASVVPARPAEFSSVNGAGRLSATTDACPETLDATSWPRPPTPRPPWAAGGPTNAR